MVILWRENETNACLRGEESNTDCRNSFCLRSACSCPGGTEEPRARSRSLLGRHPPGGAAERGSQETSVCQEEILPDTAGASPVFFQHQQHANAVSLPRLRVHMKTLLFTADYCASKCGYAAKCHHHQFVLLAGWFYALSSFGKCFAGRYIFLSIKHC